MVLLSAVIGTANCCPQDVHTATAGVLLSHFVTLIALIGIVIIRYLGHTLVENRNGLIAAAMTFSAICMLDNKAQPAVPSDKNAELPP
jgi:hypothetical protein